MKEGGGGEREGSQTNNVMLVNTYANRILNFLVSMAMLE